MWKIFGVFICTCAVALAINECSINLREDLKGYSPIILVNGKRDIFKPTGKVNTFSEGSSLHLVCTGSRNAIKSVNQQSMDIQCSGGQFVDTNKNPVALNATLCRSIPLSKLRKTNHKCANDKGVLFVSGMEVYNKFHSIFEICYNSDTQTTLYTHNTLRGSVVKYNIRESSRPKFHGAGMGMKTSDVDDIYKQTNQLQVFERLFGKDQKFIDKTNFLSRGHLSPDADFMFGYEHFATYYFTNAALQYQPVNGGNWVKVEEMARALAAAYGDDIESYNGYLGMVEFPRNGQMIQVYLDDKQQFYIPKYYYKVLLEKSSNSAIVLLSVNNPFTASKADEFCTNVCDKVHMNQANFADVSKGYTFCCELNDFKKTVSYLPKEVEAKNLLMWKD